MNPWISVIVPTKDRPGQLRHALQSIAEQSYENFEILVQDGGGENHDEFHGRVHYVREPDTCIAQAVNRAAKRAHGNLLHIAQDDNTMLPGTLASAAEAYAPGGWSVGCMIVEDETGGQRRQCSQGPWDEDVMIRAGNLLSEPTVFFPRDAFLDLGGMDESFRYCQDFELWGRLGAALGAPVYRDHDDSLYRLWPGCISREHEAEMWAETAAIQQRWALIGFGCR